MFGKLMIRLLIAPNVFLLFLRLPAFGTGAENIRLNQIGFYRFGPKIAVVVAPEAWRFSVKSPDLSTTYYSGRLSQPKKWEASAETVAIADFSEFSRPGTYVLDAGGAGISYPFRIGASMHRDLLRGLIRTFYYQRASTGLPEQYAGLWSRNAGHPDTRVIVHASAASDSTVQKPRRVGEAYPSAGGWYDAGDYGKYVVNAGITVYTLLALYEQFPVFFDTFSLNIPRPIGALPDLLTEIKWELDWLLTMQDPADGSVYHKLTSLDFCGFIMPDQDQGERYFIGKGSAAAFDFAAVCAVAFRIYAKTLPGFADSCLTAAKRAWAWGVVHPNMSFKNPERVTTGEYGDGDLRDEQNWAANELFLATGDTLFRAAAMKTSGSYSVPGWPNVSMLGMYSLANSKKDSAAVARIVSSAKGLGTLLDATPYRTLPYGIGDFYWGSNAVAANDGMIFIEAFLATRDASYFDRAVNVLDYCAGRNAVGYCFVTGFGSKSPQSPSHRPSSADGIAAPAPGFLVGGPNWNLKRDEGGACGAEAYADKPAAKLWIDDECSYGSNEVAINWNAPAAFLAGAIEAIYADPSFHVNGRAVDTLSPAIDSIVVIDLKADRVTIKWKTDKIVSAAIQYAADSLFASAHRQFSDGTMQHTVTISGLIPNTRYFYRLVSIDNRGTAAGSPVMSFLTPGSPLWEGFSFDPSVVALLPGADLKIAFTARPGLGALLSYARGGDARKQNAPFTENCGNYQATVPGGDIIASGILFSFTLTAATDTLTTPVWGISPDSPMRLSDTIPYKLTYRLISIPMPLTLIESSGFFSEQMGGSAPWRYFGYDAITGKYVPNGAVGGGLGGWLYAGDKRTILMETSVLKPDGNFFITLMQGWNCIGNPFPFPIFWENALVRFQGNVMRVFDGAAGQLIRRQMFWYSDTTQDRMNNGQYFSNRGMLLSDTTRLNPWQGYWVYAEQNNVELGFNPTALTPKLPMAKKKGMDQKQWQVGFSACANGEADDAAIIGESPWALDGYDEFDSPKPPAASEGVIVGVLHPQWQCRTALFASDIARYSPTGGHEWLVAVQANGNENVRLSWQVGGEVSGFLYLSDPIAGATLNMMRTNTYEFSFLPGEARRVFSAKFSASEDMRFSSLPTAWSLRRNAPNPYHHTTVITFSIPGRANAEIRPCAVRVNVLDISGRRLGTILNGLRYPGNYSVLWDGTDDSRRKLPQGLYIIHFRADGFSGAVKTHLVD
jgi:endoglucanase